MQDITRSINKAIYLDHQATTPPHPEIKTKVGDWIEAWGNPGSLHQIGRSPKVLLREARQGFAALIGADPLEVIFTSGGSEANSLALHGLSRNQPPNKRHLIISGVEHPSLQKAADALREQGFRVSHVGIDREGRFDFPALDEYLQQGDVFLVSVMLANNETGHIYPIARIAEKVHAAGALLHSDCVQALGKIPLDMPKLNVDLASFAGHKFYSLKGAGALWVKKGLHISPIIFGGGQERKRRGGTENVLALASMGFMASKKDLIYPQGQRLSQLRDRFEHELLLSLANVHVTGREAPRTPGASSLVIDDIDGETLLMSLDMKGFCVSTGAACSSGSPEPSPGLLAMGLSRTEAQASLRVGMGWETTDTEIDLFLIALKDSVSRLRWVRQAAREQRLQRKEFTGARNVGG